MAYRSNYTGPDVDKGVFNSLNGPKFITTDEIDITKLGVSSDTSAALSALRSYIGAEVSETQDLTNRVTVALKLSNVDSLSPSSTLVILASEYTEKKSTGITELGVTFRIKDYFYKLHILNSLDASKYSSWVLEKTSTTYIEKANVFLNRIVMELSISDLVESLTKEQADTLQELLLTSPIIFLRKSGSGSSTLYTDGIRMTVLGASYTQVTSRKTEFRAILSYSKKSDNSSSAKLSEMGSCQLKIDLEFSGDTLTNKDVQINYLPTLGFE